MDGFCQSKETSKQVIEIEVKSINLSELDLTFAIELHKGASVSPATHTLVKILKYYPATIPKSF